jgi:hypothetical protein
MTPDPSGKTTPSRTRMSEAEIAVNLLGSDPWMRFDLWATRAWEAAERANTLALEASAPISSEDAVFDPRVGALFHAAEVAKEFASMVNPLMAAIGGEFSDEEPSVGVHEIFTSTIPEDESTD